MQLGKLSLLKENQRVVYKTAPNRTKSHQRDAAKKQNAKFEPLRHSVYEGRDRLGYYVRISLILSDLKDSRQAELRLRKAWKK
jgi:hypothetical protein